MCFWPKRQVDKEEKLTSLTSAFHFHCTLIFNIFFFCLEKSFHLFSFILGKCDTWTGRKNNTDWMVLIEFVGLSICWESPICCRYKLLLQTRTCKTCSMFLYYIFVLFKIFFSILNCIFCRILSVFDLDYTMLLKVMWYPLG